MPRRRSLTSTLYRAARLSNNARAASRWTRSREARDQAEDVRQEHERDWQAAENLRAEVMDLSSEFSSCSLACTRTGRTGTASRPFRMSTRRRWKSASSF